MRRLVILGACSLAGALSMAGCGDDDVVPGGRAGSAGTGNTAGGGGTGGMAGGGVGGNAGSTAGSPSGGNAGVPGGGSAGEPNGGSAGDVGDPDAGDGGDGPPCTGCVELRVPVNGPDQDTLFQFGLTPPADFTD